MVQTLNGFKTNWKLTKRTASLGNKPEHSVWKILTSGINSWTIYLCQEKSPILHKTCNYIERKGCDPIFHDFYEDDVNNYWVHFGRRSGPFVRPHCQWTILYGTVYVYACIFNRRKNCSAHSMHCVLNKAIDNSRYHQTKLPSRIVCPWYPWYLQDCIHQQARYHPVYPANKRQFTVLHFRVCICFVLFVCFTFRNVDFVLF